jgi:SAM-dependent methyltransferase
LDRYYIENFLRSRRADIRGRVLEIAEDVYTQWFGGDQVERSDILQYEEGEHPRASFTGDLQDAPHIPDDTFDCVIVTQTLQLIYDVPSALATIHRILRPGGVLLTTVPGISQVNRQDCETWGELWCWSFTKLSVERLLREHFPSDGVEVEAFGNVLIASGFLYGMGQDDLSRAELDERDPDYEVLITGWARKAGAAP